MAEEKTATNSQDLNIQDLAAMKAIIDLASERNAFKPAEMAVVGTVYSKLDLFLKTVEEQQKIAQAQAAAAKETPNKGETTDAGA
jgi:hypothetical protein